MQKAKDIQCKVVQVLNSKETRGSRWEIRLVKWVIDGVEGKTQLEKRSFFKKKDGTFSDRGGAKGFTLEDWNFLIDNMTDITMFMNG